MSNDTAIMELAEKIGQAMAQTEQFQQKKEAEETLRRDKEARKLVKDFQNLKNSYERMEKLGHLMTDKNKAQLKESENKAMSNPTVKGWYDCAQNFYDLVIAVNNKMRQGILK